jgi:NADH-quinone oxidoreductase subunit C
MAGDEAAAGDAPVEPEPETVLGATLASSRGHRVAHPDRAGLAEWVLALRDDEGFGMCIDVTAVDYLAYEAPRDLPASVEPERFEVVYQFLSLGRRERLRARVQVPEGDPVVPSLFEVHPGTEAMEREVFDLFGIRFDGHPDLTRILMPEDWDGHPLRKDYAIGKIPVQFKGVTNAR